MRALGNTGDDSSSDEGAADDCLGKRDNAATQANAKTADASSDEEGYNSTQYITTTTTTTTTATATTTTTRVEKSSTPLPSTPFK